MMPWPSSVTSSRARPTLRDALLLGAAAMLLLTAFPERLPAKGRPAVKGDVILMLGTHGGPGLTKPRSEPASVLIVDGRPYLIDCGIGTMRRLLDARLPSPTIGTIFITHNHPDHALGLVDVLANDFLSVDFGPPGRSRTFDVYGPPQTAPLVRAAYEYIRIPYGIFAAEHLGASTLVDPFKAHVIDHDGLVYRDDKIRVTAVENTHYQLMAAKYRARMKSYAYRFETPYGVIVFTGDTGPSEAVTRLAKGADVLISEVEALRAPARRQRVPASPEAAARAKALQAHMRMEHLPMRDVGEMASKAKVKALVLHHFVGAGNGQRFVAGVKKYYSGPVYAGKDLARYCLGTPNAGGALRPCQ